MVPLSLKDELITRALSFCTGSIDEGLIHHVLILQDRHGLTSRGVVEANALADLSFLLSSLVNPLLVPIEDHTSLSVLLILEGSIRAITIVSVSFLGGLEDMIHIIFAIGASRHSGLDSYSSTLVRIDLVLTIIK